MIRALIPLVGLGLTTALAAQSWSRDHAAAAAAAEAANKDLLLLFTGSDWCPPCKKLHQEVCGTEEFVRAASEQFVLVELDYPKDKSAQSETEIAQNAALLERYQPGGYPTLLLTDASGQAYAKRTGYRGEGAATVLADLAKSREDWAEMRETLARAEKLEGKERAALLHTALSRVSRESLRMYEDLVDEVERLDPALPSLASVTAIRSEGDDDVQVVGATALRYDNSADVNEALELLDMHHGGGAKGPAVGSPEYDEAVRELLVAYYTGGGWPKGALGNRALIALADWADHRGDVAMFRRCLEDLAAVREGLGGNEAFLARWRDRLELLEAGKAEGTFKEFLLSRPRGAGRGEAPRGR